MRIIPPVCRQWFAFTSPSSLTRTSALSWWYFRFLHIFWPFFFNILRAMDFILWVFSNIVETVNAWNNCKLNMTNLWNYFHSKWFIVLPATFHLQPLKGQLTAAILSLQHGPWKSWTASRNKCRRYKQGNPYAPLHGFQTYANQNIQWTSSKTQYFKTEISI